MPGGDENSNGGRVTTREFYDAQMKMSADMAEMERRIIKRLDEINDCLPTIKRDVAVNGRQIDTNKQEIDNIRRKSDAWNTGNSIGIIIATVLSAFGIHENGG